MGVLEDRLNVRTAGRRYVAKRKEENATRVTQGLASLPEEDVPVVPNSTGAEPCPYWAK